MEGLVARTRASIVGTAARTRHFLCCLRSSACCLLPACRGLLQAACGFPPAAFALGCLRCWCVLQREEHIVSSRLFGVVCGQGTVASWCEMKSGLEWRSLTSFGSRGTRNAVAPPLGRLDFGSQISGPKSSPQSGAACQAPHCEVQGTRCQNTGCILGPKGGPRNQASWWPRRLGQNACSGNDSNALPGESTSHRAHCFTHSSPALVCLVLCPSHVSAFNRCSFVEKGSEERRSFGAHQVRPCVRPRARPTYIFDGCQKPAT